MKTEEFKTGYKTALEVYENNKQISQEFLNSLKEENKNKKDTIVKEINILKSKLYAKEKELITQEQVLNNEIKAQKENLIKVYDEHLKVFEEFKERQFKFFEISRKKAKDLNFDFREEENSSWWKYPIDIKEVNFNNTIVKIVLCTNKKPVNIYSIVVYGNSNFYEFEEMLKYQNYLDVNLLTKNNNYIDNIKLNIKEFKTLSEAKNYFNAILEHKTIKELLEVLTTLENDYKTFKEEIKNDKEFIKLYLNYKKDYYENCYSGREETEEYKQIIEELENL